MPAPEVCMSDLADFLRARIAEEERACQASAHGSVSPPEAAISPSRLLMNCAARRKVVELHEIHVVDAGVDAMIDGESGSKRAGQNERDFTCPTLRLLALPYFDHPDYKQHWQVGADGIGLDVAPIERPRASR